MNNNKDIEKLREKLFERYLDFCEEFSQKMPAYEFGYAIIEYATKMLYYCAPNEKVAFETIKLAIEAGREWHKTSGEIK